MSPAFRDYELIRETSTMNFDMKMKLLLHFQSKLCQRPFTEAVNIYILKISKKEKKRANLWFKTGSRQRAHSVNLMGESLSTGSSVT